MGDMMKSTITTINTILEDKILEELCKLEIKLNNANKIKIGDKKGTRYNYLVRVVLQYKPKEEQEEKFFENVESYYKTEFLKMYSEKFNKIRTNMLTAIEGAIYKKINSLKTEQKFEIKGEDFVYSANHLYDFFKEYFNEVFIPIKNYMDSNKEEKSDILFVNSLMEMSKNFTDFESEIKTSPIDLDMLDVNDRLYKIINLTGRLKENL